ncbi:hypothetical protein GCM10022243_48770 [Saccharothrix violaceirubra]|uniref:Type I-E CRISPR-associated protein Cse1/CasA n=1 Tax=Saccharothrix violaceirubra TaxID=413306 RepID=A0A7W7WUG7_9PSEU|nr:type I-E CRISPR-associated protein Cse1/CasA [Saccharothrix violaceirubra]MBB4963782.1 hypothetical protein [Saccharothrix violaceirubra]
MTGAPSYDLLSRPWIPVYTTGGEGEREVGLREALQSAHRHNLARLGLSGEGLVLLRLLLAVYEAAAGPVDDDGWDAAWRAPTLDPHGRIADYLDRWANRFDLYDPDRPFAQCAHLAEPNRGAVELHPAWLGGQGAAWFHPGLYRGADHPPWEPGEAARNLLVRMAYDTGGIKPAAPGDPAGKGNKVYGSRIGPLGATVRLVVLGATLKDTLLLNLPPAPRAPGDAPEWERDEGPPAGIRVDRVPAGRLELATMPARRLRLFPDRDGRVARWAWHDGDRVAGYWNHYHRLDPTLLCRDSRDGQGTADPDAFDPYGHQPRWWLLTRPLHVPPAADPRRWHSGALVHAVGAARRGLLPADLPLRVWVSQAVYNTHGSVAVGDHNGRVDLGPVGVHAAEPTARVVAFLDHQTAATLRGLAVAAAEALPHVTLGDRLTPDAYALERLWSDTTRRLAALDTDPSHEELAGVCLDYGRRLVGLCAQALDRLPFGGSSGMLMRAKAGVALERYVAYFTDLPTKPYPRKVTPVQARAFAAAAAGARARRSGGRKPGSGRGAGGGRPSPMLVAFGEEKTQAQWARDERCVVSVSALRSRLINGWDPEAALTTPGRRAPGAAPDDTEREGEESS